MRKKNLVMAGCVMALSFVMMTGCGNNVADASKKVNTTVDGTQNQSDWKQLPKDDGSKMVQVTKVDGNTVTATVGEDMFGGKDPSKGGSDSRPERPDQDGSDKSDSDNKQAPPDMNSSDGKQTPPDKDGQPPERPDGNMPFKATDETLTFTITSDTKIMTGGREDSKEGTVEDIKENSILRVSVNDKNEAQTIMIMGSK